jgi:hypothetical protein
MIDFDEPITLEEEQYIKSLKSLEGHGFSLSQQGQLILHLEQQLLFAINTCNDAESRASAWERNASDNETRYNKATEDHLVFLKNLLQSLTEMKASAEKAILSHEFTSEIAMEILDKVISDLGRMIK